MCKEHERRHRNKMTAMLLSIEKPEEFWNLVKRMQQWGKPDADIDFAIPPETWQHFNSLLNDGEDTPT